MFPRIDSICYRNFQANRFLHLQEHLHIHVLPVSSTLEWLRERVLTRDAELGGKGGLPPPPQCWLRGIFCPPPIPQIIWVGPKNTKFGAEDAVFENIGQIFVNLLLKKAIKVDFGAFLKNRIPLVKRPKMGVRRGRKNFAP